MKNSTFTIAKNFALTAAVLSAMVTTAKSQETADQYSTVTLSLMQEVCTLARGEDAVIKISPKAHAACDGDEKQMPTLIKKGTRFTKARTGAEFNTLIANLDFFKKN